jgi:long-chain acyl-CoA synthetase
VTNLSVYLTESATNHPDARAVVSDAMTTSYSALNDDVAKFADYLGDGGLQPGDRVGVMLPNGPELVTVFYGVMHAGGVVVPLNPALHARALDFYLTTTGARMLFVTPQHAIVKTAAAVTAGVQPVEIGSRGIAPFTAGFSGRSDPVNRAAGDVAVVLPLAETMGAHTIQLTHGELASSQAVTAGRLLPLGENEVVLGCLPMAERSGLTCGLLSAVSSGATLVLPGFDPAFDPASALETMAAERITVFEGVPAMYLALLDAAQHIDNEFTSLRVCVLADGSLPVDVSRRLAERFGCVIVDAEDLSAAGPLRITHA